jgi:hypothetical protein
MSEYEETMLKSKIESFSDFLVFIGEAKISKTILGEKISKEWSKAKDEIFRENIKNLVGADVIKMEDIVSKQDEMMIEIHKISMGKRNCFLLSLRTDQNCEILYLFFLKISSNNSGRVIKKISGI